MFIKVTRSAAVSALAAGLEVRLDHTGEILQVGHPELVSKRYCRRLLSDFAEGGWDGETRPQVTFSLRARP